MPFAPHEIEKKKFVISLRGYQTEEVDAFLRAVAADYSFLSERLERAERMMAWTREVAEREGTELRAAAVADAAGIREAAESEAAGRFAEIARQAEELHRLEAAVAARVHALEEVVGEARHTLAHLGGLYPNENVANGIHYAA